MAADLPPLSGHQMNMRLKNILYRALEPRDQNPEKRRREKILNILLLSSAAVAFSMLVIRLVDFYSHGADGGISLIATAAILLTFSALYFISRRGHYRLAASGIIIAYTLPTLYFFARWGADLPAGLLLTVLIICLAGILFGARYAFIYALAVNSFMIAITIAHQKRLLTIADYWRLNMHDVGDAVSYALIFMVIAAVAWIFVTDSEKSLKRARAGEAALKAERDLLETRVEERTREIRALKAEKISHLYRLAEIGRLSSGVFHDLVNPLTAINLSLESMKSQASHSLEEAQNSTNKMVGAVRRMEGLIIGLKNQARRQCHKSIFYLNHEIRQTIDIFSYQARRAGVEIIFSQNEEIYYEGESVKFSQIIGNLLANAIEACSGKAPAGKININLSRNKDKIAIKVRDNGPSIPEEYRDKIFQEFFTTKDQGLGLGLSLSLRLAEDDFGGQLTMQSSNDGTIFCLTLPAQYREKNKT